MKKLFLFSMLGLLLMNCTNEDSVGESVETTPPESSFLSISIVSGNSTGTRAEANGDYTEGDGVYRDGTEEESCVKNVLFLFYDADGKPAKAVKKGDTYYTYSLWENVNNGNINGDHGQTVEHILNTTISLTVPRKNDKPVLPAQLVAIVNPPSDYSELVEKKLSELPEVVEDYEKGYLDRETKTGRFIMTNSVYVDNEKIINSTALKENDYYSDKDATSHPVVVVYVERVLARIDLGINIEPNSATVTSPDKTPSGDDIYFTGESYTQDGGKKNVYVRFLGWNVYNTPDKSRLIKKINKDWTNADVMGTSNGVAIEPWNVAAYHRSFWAINPEKEKITHKSGSFIEPENESFGSYWAANQYEIPSIEKYTTAYFHENAAPFENQNAAPTNPSSVIVAAQLVDKDGNACELVQWAGTYYTWEDLMTQFCSQLNYWYKTSDTKDNNGNTINTYTHISPEDLTWTSTPGSTKVSVVVDNTKEWYILSDGVEEGNAKDDDFKQVTASEINTVLADKFGENNIKYWKNGYTYFRLKIRHLGLGEDASAYYGIVRNHIYEINVKSLQGLGTPVVDPHIPIVINPDDEENTNLSAEVRILSWRVVKQSYDLTW